MHLLRSPPVAGFARPLPDLPARCPVCLALAVCMGKPLPRVLQHGGEQMSKPSDKLLPRRAKLVP